MKNYPNQAANFLRIRSTLDAIAGMSDDGVDVLDDGELGYGLALRKLYTFSGINYAVATPHDIESRIAIEKQKPESNQGARTNARELRRTLHDMGWISAAGKVTEPGQSLLNSAPTSDEERQILANGLVSIAVDVDGHVSHPIAVLLQLLNQSESPHRAGLELALEAADDSREELERVLTLYEVIRGLPPDQRASALDISEARRANSVKVFPTLAKYAGLVTEDNQGVFRIAPPGLARLGINSAITPTTAVPEPDEATPPTNSSAGRRNLTLGKKRLASETGRQRGRAVPASLTPEQQGEAQNRLNERTENHQNLVSYFSGLIGDDSGELYEDSLSFDLLWVRDHMCHVFEMKTIDSDSDSQVIRAVGQLFYYKHFNVANQFPGKDTTLTIVVDSSLPADLCDYLESLGIGAILAREDLRVEALNPTGEAVVALLPPSPTDV